MYGYLHVRLSTCTVIYMYGYLHDASHYYLFIASKLVCEISTESDESESEVRGRGVSSQRKAQVLQVTYMYMALS